MRGRDRELVVLASGDIRISPDEMVPGPVIEAVGIHGKSEYRVQPLLGLHPYRMKLRLTPSLDVAHPAANLPHYFRVHAPNEEIEELASRLTRSQAVSIARK